ncbi:HWE histidine kinase domain-containing protein [Sphingomonas sp. NFR15]|uniref:HWE histidine kinase domain-containing protein n=1 Tax=Sphingomonas sp. NFR15 TaxID=1566282 RepID=UPI00088F4118|nr:HWE histidine kinase domain-containing protein [Sphingomonas sp. NFR15]SDA35863.1 PAS domain S-box-containing protein [Sphingomonas sp. NFR15]
METALAEDLSHAPVFVRRPGGEIVYWTQGARELYGYTPKQAIGHSSHDLLRTEFPRSLHEIDTELERNGSWDGLLRHCRQDGRHIWTESRWRRRRDTEGRGLFVVETNTDVSDREHLSRELDHRVKNLLAVVQGLAHLTLRTDEPDKVDRFEARLAALASANDILLRLHWSGASLKEVE